MKVYVGSFMMGDEAEVLLLSEDSSYFLHPHFLQVCSKPRERLESGKKSRLFEVHADVSIWLLCGTSHRLGERDLAFLSLYNSYYFVNLIVKLFIKFVFLFMHVNLQIIFCAVNR